MKKCTMKNCTTPTELQEFNKNKSRKDGLNTVCKVCSRLKSRDYYKNNPSLHKKNVRKRTVEHRKTIQENLIALFQENPCMDCKNSDIRVLEFDHLRDKKFGISRMIAQGYSWESILTEIAKCDIVCRNCHAIRTYSRMKSYRNIYGGLA